MKENITNLQQILYAMDNNTVLIDEVYKVNKFICKYGLRITKEDAKKIVTVRNKSLKDNGRIEFKKSIISEIIEKFASSPYIMQSNATETFCKLLEIFYEYKNETFEVLSDEELIRAMVKYFNGYCKGSLELLEGKALYKLAENVRRGLKNPFDISCENNK